MGEEGRVLTDSQKCLFIKGLQIGKINWPVETNPEKGSQVVDRSASQRATIAGMPNKL